MIIRALITAALLFGATAFAADGNVKFVAACRSASDVMPEIEACSDNPIAANAAESCRAELLAEWQAAQGELASVMSVAHKNLDVKQQADFFHSHSDMQLAIDKLRDLSERTANAADMLADYPRIMFDNPYADPGLVGSSNCYKKSFLKIGKIVDDLDVKAEQGWDALAAVDQLRGVVQARDDHMDNTAVSIASARLRGPGAGSSGNGASDVTGVGQDLARQAGAAEAGATGAVSARTYPSPRQETKDDSSITSAAAGGAVANALRPAAGKPYSEEDFSTPGLGSKIDPSGVFSRRGSLSADSGVVASAGPAASASTNAGAKADASTSIGAVLWSSSGGDRNMQLAVSAPSAVTGEMPAAGAGAGAGAGADERAPASTSLDAVVAQPSGGETRGSVVVAGAESDLFRLVSSRYRATELFRRARVSDVPLSGFDSNLKR